MRHRRLLLAVTLALVVAVVLPFAALAAPSAQPPIPHALEGFANCTTCHQVGGAGAGVAGGTGMPAGHASFTNAQCTSCHQVAQAPAPAATATTAPAAQPTAPAAEATATPAEGKGVAAPTATTAPAATAAPSLPRTGSVPPQALFLAGTAIVGLAAIARRMVSR